MLRVVRLLGAARIYTFAPSVHRMVMKGVKSCCVFNGAPLAQPLLSARTLLLPAPNPRPTFMAFRQRVVVAVPAVNESRTLSSWLETEGFDAVQRATAKSASEDIVSRPFDLLVADYAFVFSGGLRAVGRARFPETPVIVLAPAAVVRRSALDAQFMFLERPVDRATFICTVTMALMDARPERRSPRRSVIAFEAIVNGVPSHIIDVSKEGVRLELPRERGLVKPHFVLRVPMMGVGVTVQRRWMRTPSPDEQIDVMWCGGALVQNTSVAEQGWRSFIDTLPSDPRSSRPASVKQI